MSNNRYILGYKGAGRRTPVQQAFEIKSEALAFVERANENVPPIRQVTVASAVEVLRRSLNSTRGFAFSVRKSAALNELVKFVGAVQGDMYLALSSKHSDLFPVSHPMSTRIHVMSDAALSHANLQWVLADSSVQESLRPLLASALSVESSDAEKTYATARIRAFDGGYEVLAALTAAFSGNGNSRWARRLRAMRQRRDRKGRFAYMGGGMRALVRRRDGSVEWLNGRPVGAPSEGNDFQMELGDGRIAVVPAANAEAVRAFLPTAGRQAFSGVKADYTTEDASAIIDESALRFVDAPDGWNVVPTEQWKQVLGDKPFQKVLGDGDYLIGDDGNGNFEVFDFQNNQVGSADNLRDAIKASDVDALGGREPEETAPSDVIAEGLRDIAANPEASDIAAIANKAADFLENKADLGDETPADFATRLGKVAKALDEGAFGSNKVGFADDFVDAAKAVKGKVAADELERRRAAKEQESKKAKFNAPEGAYKISPDAYEPEGRQEGIVAEDYTDDPAELAQMFSRKQLVSALKQALLGRPMEVDAADLPPEPVAPEGKVDPAKQRAYEKALREWEAVEDNTEPKPEEPQAEPPTQEQMDEYEQAKSEWDALARERKGEVVAADGNGLLPFDGGDEPVPAEALRDALNEQGANGNDEVAKIYNEGLADEDKNPVGKKAKKPAAEKEAPAAETEAPEAPEAPEEVSDVADAIEAEISEQELMEIEAANRISDSAVDIASDVANKELPELLAGLSDDELQYLAETGDYRAYLAEDNFEQELPEAFHDLDPNPFPEDKVVTVEEGDELNQAGWPVGWSNDPYYLAKNFSTDDLVGQFYNAMLNVNEGEEGKGRFVEVDTDGQPFFALIDAEAIRDALKLQAIDTDALVDDFIRDYDRQVDEELDVMAGYGFYASQYEYSNGDRLKVTARKLVGNPETEEGLFEVSRAVKRDDGWELLPSEFFNNEEDAINFADSLIEDAKTGDGVEEVTDNTVDTMMEGEDFPEFDVEPDVFDEEYDKHAAPVIEFFENNLPTEGVAEDDVFNIYKDGYETFVDYLLNIPGYGFHSIQLRAERNGKWYSVATDMFEWGDPKDTVHFDNFEDARRAFEWAVRNSYVGEQQELNYRGGDLEYIAQEIKRGASDLPFDDAPPMVGENLPDGSLFNRDNMRRIAAYAATAMDLAEQKEGEFSAPNLAARIVQAVRLGSLPNFFSYDMTDPTFYLKELRDILNKEIPTHLAKDVMENLGEFFEKYLNINAKDVNNAVRFLYKSEDPLSKFIPSVKGNRVLASNLADGDVINPHNELADGFPDGMFIVREVDAGDYEQDDDGYPSRPVSLVLEPANQQALDAALDPNKNIEGFFEEGKLYIRVSDAEVVKFGTASDMRKNMLLDADFSVPSDLPVVNPPFKPEDKAKQEKIKILKDFLGVTGDNFRDEGFFSESAWADKYTVALDEDGDMAVFYKDMALATPKDAKPDANDPWYVEDAFKAIDEKVSDEEALAKSLTDKGVDKGTAEDIAKSPLLGPIAETLSDAADAAESAGKTEDLSEIESILQDFAAGDLDVLAAARKINSLRKKGKVSSRKGKKTKSPKAITPPERPTELEAPSLQEAQKAEDALLPPLTSPVPAVVQVGKVRTKDLKPGMTTLRDGFVILHVSEKVNEIGKHIVVGHFPGGPAQEKQWFPNAGIEVIQNLSPSQLPPRDDSAPAIHQPNVDDFEGGAESPEYAAAMVNWLGKLAAARKMWANAPSAANVAFDKARHPHISRVRGANLKPGDVMTSRGNFVVISAVPSTNPEDKGKYIITGYYPGHQRQEKKWNPDTEFDVYRNVALPAEGDLPAFHVPFFINRNGNWQHDKKDVEGNRIYNELIAQAGARFVAPADLPFVEDAVERADIPAEVGPSVPKKAVKDKEPSVPREPADPLGQGEFEEILRQAGGDPTKLRNLLKDKELIFFDFETTGLNPDEHNVWQLGAVKVINGEIVDEFNIYMNPERPVDPSLVRKLDQVDPDGNFISDEFLQQQISRKEAMQKFVEFAGANPLLLAQNSRFDRGYLEKIISEDNLEMAPAGYFDPQVLARMLFSEDPEGLRGVSLKPLADHFGIEMRHHDALSDTVALKQVMDAILARMIETGYGAKHISVEGFKAWAAEEDAKYQEKLAKYEVDLANWKERQKAAVVDDAVAKAMSGVRVDADNMIREANAAPQGENIAANAEDIGNSNSTIEVDASFLSNPVRLAKRDWVLNPANTRLFPARTLRYEDLVPGDIVRGKGIHSEKLFQVLGTAVDADGRLRVFYANIDSGNRSSFSFWPNNFVNDVYRPISSGSLNAGTPDAPEGDPALPIFDNFDGDVDKIPNTVETDAAPSGLRAEVTTVAKDDGGVAAEIVVSDADGNIVQVAKTDAPTAKDAVDSAADLVVSLDSKVNVAEGENTNLPPAPEFVPESPQESPPVSVDHIYPARVIHQMPMGSGARFEYVFGKREGVPGVDKKLYYIGIWDKENGSMKIAGDFDTADDMFNPALMEALPKIKRGMLGELARNVFGMGGGRRKDKGAVRNVAEDVEGTGIGAPGAIPDLPFDERGDEEERPQGAPQGTPEDFRLIPPTITQEKALRTPKTSPAKARKRKNRGLNNEENKKRWQARKFAKPPVRWVPNRGLFVDKDGVAVNVGDVVRHSNPKMDAKRGEMVVVARVPNVGRRRVDVNGKPVVDYSSYVRVRLANGDYTIYKANNLINQDPTAVENPAVNRGVNAFDGGLPDILVQNWNDLGPALDGLGIEPFGTGEDAWRIEAGNAQALVIRKEGDGYKVYLHEENIHGERAVDVDRARERRWANPMFESDDVELAVNFLIAERHNRLYGADFAPNPKWQPAAEGERVEDEWNGADKEVLGEFPDVDKQRARLKQFALMLQTMDGLEEFSINFSEDRNYIMAWDKRTDSFATVTIDPTTKTFSAKVYEPGNPEPDRLGNFESPVDAFWAGIGSLDKRKGDADVIRTQPPVEATPAASPAAPSTPDVDVNNASIPENPVQNKLMARAEIFRDIEKILAEEDIATLARLNKLTVDSDEVQGVYTIRNKDGKVVAGFYLMSDWLDDKEFKIHVHGAEDENGMYANMGDEGFNGKFGQADAVEVLRDLLMENINAADAADVADELANNPDMLNVVDGSWLESNAYNLARVLPKQLRVGDYAYQQGNKEGYKILSISGPDSDGYFTVTRAGGPGEEAVVTQRLFKDSELHGIYRVGEDPGIPLAVTPKVKRQNKMKPIEVLEGFEVFDRARLIPVLEQIREKLPSPTNRNYDRQVRKVSVQIDSLLESLRSGLLAPDELAARHWTLPAIVDSFRLIPRQEYDVNVRDAEVALRDIHDKIKSQKDAYRKEQLDKLIDNAGKPFPDALVMPQEDYEVGTIAEYLREVAGRLPDEYGALQDIYLPRDKKELLRLASKIENAGFFSNILSSDFSNLAEVVKHLRQNVNTVPGYDDLAFNLAEFASKMIDRKAKEPIGPFGPVNAPIIDPEAVAKERIANQVNLFTPSNWLRDFFQEDPEDLVIAYPFLQGHIGEIFSFLGDGSAKPLAALDYKSRRALELVITSKLRRPERIQNEAKWYLEQRGLPVDEGLEAIQNNLAELVFALHEERMAVEPNRTGVGVGDAVLDWDYQKVKDYIFQTHNGTTDRIPLVLDGVDTGFDIQQNPSKGISDTFLLWHRDSGQFFIYKREMDEGRANAEIAGALLIQGMNMHGGITTTRARNDSRVLLMTKAGDGARLESDVENYANLASKGLRDEEVGLLAALQMSILDAAIGNTDRHQNNYMIARLPLPAGAQTGDDVERYQIFPIDNGFGQLFWVGNRDGVGDPVNYYNRAGGGLATSLERRMGTKMYDKLRSISAQQLLQYLERMSPGDIDLPADKLDIMLKRIRVIAEHAS